MRIKTQFSLIILLFGIVLAVIAASAVVTSRQAETVGKQERIASGIAQGAGDLSYLTNDYLIYREAQQLKRCQSRFASLSRQVASLHVEKPEQQVLVLSIRANEQRLKQVFESVASVIGVPSAKRTTALDLAFLRVSWSRMAIYSQGLLSDASRLSQLLHLQVEQIRETRTMLMYIMVGLFGALLFASYLLTQRRILKSIVKLQAGAAVIGSGNLDFVITEKQNDEIGDLSHAFNQMTANLKRVIASKEELEREVTRRKQAEEELRLQREWLRVTLSSIGDAVMATDTSGKITFLNPVATTLTGWQFEEAMNQPINKIFRIINEKTRQPAEDLVARVLNEKRAVALANDTALVTKDGGEIPIEDSAAPILDSNGAVIGSVLVFHDVSEKRRTQEALRQAHDRAAWLARFPEQNPNPVIRVSADGTVLYCNPSTTKVAGWRCEVGHLLQEELLPLVGRAIAEGTEVQADVQMDKKVYLVWVVPFPEERYVNIYSRNITERRKAEETLRENEQRLNRAQEIAHLGSWELDLVNNRLTWSDEVYRIFGLQPREFIATYEAFLDAVHPDDRAAVDAAYSDSVRDGRDTYEIEHRVVRKSTGEVRFVHERCEHIRDLTGRIVRSVGMVHDITGRKWAEEALRQRTIELQQLTETLDHQVKERTEALEEANKALRQLSIRLLSAQEEERKRVAGELHDTIGSCLSGIKFKVESALEEIQQAPKTATQSLNTIVPVIQDAIEECRRIQMDLRPSMLDDLGLLPTLSWFFRRFRTIYSGIRVEQDTTIEESELPNALKIVIYRVIQEAMNNAAKHSKADLVRISLRKVHNKMELFVADNGCGFSVQQRLFLDDSKRGLGMTSMRERTELSGGSFAIESAEGKGTMIRASWNI
jgi:PAS domain S-box-containing protein